MRRPWIAGCAAGEAAGIALVALAYATSGRGLAPPVPAILAAGAWEGLCLGLAQGLVLARAGVCLPCWTLATAAAATLGYALSLAGGAGLDAGTAGSDAPPPALLLVGAAIVGAVMGGLMGAAQWSVAKRILSFWRWTLANVAGWAAAMPCIFAGAAVAGETWPRWQVSALGAVSGAAAGALLGLLTAPALPAEPASAGRA